MTTQDKRGSFINLFIGLSLLVFGLMVIWFLFMTLLHLAPFIGILAAIAGGIWYAQAEDDAHKVQALQLVLAGGFVAVIFGIIF